MNAEMQDKIMRILESRVGLGYEYLTDDAMRLFDRELGNAAAEIAALVEGKVMGQRDGKITLQYATDKMTGVSFWHVWVKVGGHSFIIGTTSDPDIDGQRVRVRVIDA